MPRLLDYKHLHCSSPAKNPDAAGVVLEDAEDVGDGVAVALDHEGLGAHAELVVPALLKQTWGKLDYEFSKPTL